MVDFAPGMRTIIRDEEWMIKKITTNSMGRKTLHCVGVSTLVKDKEAIFLSDLEEITIVNLQSAFPDQKWNPQGSGIETRSQYVDGLKEMWTNIVHQNDGGDIEGFKEILQNYINGQE